MMVTAAQVFCSGCNMVIAPNDPEAYDSKEGCGRVHGKACEARAAAMRHKGNEAKLAAHRAFEQIRNGMQELLRKAQLAKKPPVGIALEFTGTPAGFGTYTTERYAAMLGRALTALYAACQNGKSHLRPEILAFAAASTRALGHKVHVTMGEAVVRSRIERFDLRVKKANPKARRMQKNRTR